MAQAHISPTHKSALYTTHHKAGNSADMADASKALNNVDNGHSASKESPTNNTNASLLLDRIINAPLNQQGMDFVAKALANSQNWQGLNQTGLLAIAGVAEQFGQIKQAHTIYNYLHQRFPQSMAAWQMHFDLLLTLEKFPMAQTLVTIMEKYFVPEETIPFKEQLRLYAQSTGESDLASQNAGAPVQTNANADASAGVTTDREAHLEATIESPIAPAVHTIARATTQSDLRLDPGTDLGTGLGAELGHAPSPIPSQAPNPPLKRETPNTEDTIAPAVEKTFIAFQNEQQNTALFQSLFRGRSDVFARQWADKSIGKAGYVPINQPLTGQDIEDHLSGKRSYGIYLLDGNSMVCNGVIDLDLIPELRNHLSGQDKACIRKETVYLFRTIKDRSENAGIQLLWEISGGKGYHIWLIMDNPVPAQEMRRALHSLCYGLANDCTCFSMEIFPKQDRLTGKGYGNLVKLPLGVHRLSGNRSRFCALQDNNTITGYSEPFGPLKTFIPTTREQLTLLAEQNGGGAKLVAFPAKESAKQRIQAKNAPSHQAIQQGQKTQYFPDFQRPAKLAIPASIQDLLSKCAPIHTIVDNLGKTRQLSINEEKVLLGVLRFLPGGKEAIHELIAVLPEYNRALVDYKISRVRGTVLGCKRIHRLLEYGGVACAFNGTVSYEHPLCHFPELRDDLEPVAEKVENLQDALGQLRQAISQTERYL